MELPSTDEKTLATLSEAAVQEEISLITLATLGLWHYERANRQTPAGRNDVLKRIKTERQRIARLAGQPGPDISYEFSRFPPPSSPTAPQNSKPRLLGMLQTWFVQRRRKRNIELGKGAPPLHDEIRSLYRRGVSLRELGPLLDQLKRDLEESQPPDERMLDFEHAAKLFIELGKVDEALALFPAYRPVSRIRMAEMLHAHAESEKAVTLLDGMAVAPADLPVPDARELALVQAYLGEETDARATAAALPERDRRSISRALESTIALGQFFRTGSADITSLKPFVAAARRRRFPRSRLHEQTQLLALFLQVGAQTEVEWMLDEILTTLLLPNWSLQYHLRLQKLTGVMWPFRAKFRAPYHRFLRRLLYETAVGMPLAQSWDEVSYYLTTAGLDWLIVDFSNEDALKEELRLA